MKIIGIGNKASIGFTEYVVSTFENKDSELIDINEFEKEMTIVSDKIKGIPFIIIALPIAEFKRWILSITDTSIFKGTSIFLLTTSNTNSNTTEIERISSVITSYGAEIINTFNLPNFNTNFSVQNGVTDVKLSLALIRKINTIKQNKFSTYFKKRPSTCGIDNTNFENCDASEY